MKDKYDDIDEYIRDLQDAIQKSDGQCAAHHYNLGLALLSKRDFMAAEGCFRDALRESPHMAEAMVQLGGICLQHGDLDGCLNYNTEAAACRPKFAVAESNIAFVHLQRRDPDKALSHLVKALKWDPKFVQARNDEVIAYFMKGDYAKCEECCRALLADEPSFAPAWQNLALALFEQERYQEAKEAMDKAASLGFSVPEGFQQEMAAKLAQ